MAPCAKAWLPGQTFVRQPPGVATKRDGYHQGTGGGGQGGLRSPIRFRPTRLAA